MFSHVFLLILVLLGVGLWLSLAAIGLMAWSLTHPPRMSDGKAAYILRRLSPADLGLRFEEETYLIRDERGKPLKIAAWWVPCPDAGGKTVVMIHGYADAKVGVIAWAPLWHSLGFNLLVPDLRAHGESGGSVCTAGYFERKDIAQVINDLRARRAEDCRQLVLFGASLGGAVAAAASIEVSDISAVVMESPYADFRRAAMAQMNLAGAPGGLLQRLALRLAAWLTYADYAAIAPAKLIPQIPCPILLIESQSDPFLMAEDRADLAKAVQAHPGPAEIWTVPNVEHLMGIVADPNRYRSRLAEFLSRSVAIQTVQV